MFTSPSYPDPLFYRYQPRLDSEKKFFSSKNLSPKGRLRKIFSHPELTNLVDIQGVQLISA